MMSVPSLIEQVQAYINASWPIEPLNCSNLFTDQNEIDKWTAIIPEHLRNRVYDGKEFHPVKLLMLLDPKTFWTESKLASQKWEYGVGFRTGLTLTPSSEDGKVKLTIAIDSDDPKTITTLERIIKEYNLKEQVPIQNTPHGGLHILLCAYVDPNDLDAIAFWEKRKSLIENAGCWLNGAKCAIKINCQQITLFPTPHRKDGAMYKLNKVMPLLNTTWVFDRIIEAFINDGLLECTPEEYHARWEQKERDDSREPFDSSEWFTLTDDEIKNAIDIILGDEVFESIYSDGCRHNNTMPIAGSCAHAHINQESTERLFEQLIEKTGDEEPEDRFGVVKQAYQRIVYDIPVAGRNVMTELFRAAHKDRDINAANDRFEEFRRALGLNYKKIRKSLNVAGFLKANNGDHVRVRECMISGIQEKEKMITKVTSTCLNCNTINIIDGCSGRPHFAWELDTIRSMISASKCINCEERLAKYPDFQEINAAQIEIQDCGTVNDMQTARVVLLNDSSDDIRISEEVVMTGFINTLTIRGRRVSMLFVGDVTDEGSGINYTKVKNEFNTLTPEEEEKIAKYIEEKGENILEAIANDFAISVIGNEYEKQGIILSCNNAAKDSVQKKTRINSFLIGDPGLAKSQLLRASTEIVPKSRYISAITMSVKTAVGIIDREPSGVYMLRPGPIVKASGAVCAYDEIGRMTFEDQPYLLSAIQEGLIPFGKHGFTRDLDGSATFILSANPSGSSGHWGKHDKTSQIPVLGVLLDRIDLVFIMHTNRDEEYLNSYAKQKLRLLDGYEKVREKEVEKHSWISKTLLYCKRFNPQFSDDVGIMITQFYVTLAKEPEFKSSPRLLDTLYNMCKSLARLKGKSTVDVRDATQIMAFFKKQYENRTELSVIIPREPLEVIKEIIVNRIEGTDCWYYLKELMTDLYEEEEQVREYFCGKLILNMNNGWQFRKIVEWCDGEPKINMLDRKKLKIAWRDSYKDTSNYGGKREGAGRPSNEEELQNNLTSDIQVRAQRESVSDPFLESSKTISYELKELDQQSKTPHSLTPRGNLNIDSNNLLYQSQEPILEPSIVPKLATQELFQVRPVPDKLIEHVNDLKLTCSFDTEWTINGQDIYCFCSIDTQNHRETLHISQFDNDQHAFMVAILEVLSRYDVITGYNILQEKSEYRENSIDSDWATISNNCDKVGLSEMFERLKSKVRRLDVYRPFSNRAIKSALEAVDVKYRGDSLAAVSKAYLGQTKLEGITGTIAESLEPSKQMEYCLRDAELSLMLLAKNNYELLEIIYNVSEDIKLDFFDTANAFGPSSWWRNKLLGHSKTYSDYQWIQETITRKNGKTETSFKFEGGYVRTPISGIHRDVRTYDFASMYPSVCIQFKISSETINCSCCEEDTSALIPQAIQDEVNAGTKGTPRNWTHYWICKKQSTGKLSEIMRELMNQKDMYKEQGLTLQSKAKKLIMNAGYGACGYVNFAYFDPRVCELITAHSRYIIKEMSKLLDSGNDSKVIYGDTDSIFVKGGGSIDIVAEAKNRFGVRFELDKTWKILFLIEEKKQYFGLTENGKLIHKTLVGMKNDRGSYFNSLVLNLISKERLEQFITEPDKALQDVIEYVESYLQSLEKKMLDLDFVRNELAYSALTKKPLDKIERAGWQADLYNEILQDCEGDKSLAQSKSQGGQVYKYWKVSVEYERITKKNKKVIKKKTKASIHPENHTLDIQKYRDTFWSSIESILLVYGVSKDKIKALKLVE